MDRITRAYANGHRTGDSRNASEIVACMDIMADGLPRSDEPVDDVKVNPKQHDADVRVRLDLVPPVLLVEVAAVLRAGARKPGRWEWNWRDNPVKLSTYIAAMERHIQSLKDGEWFDHGPQGTGATHLGCIGANVSIILDSKRAGTLIDDLPKVKSNITALMDEYRAKYTAEAKKSEI